MLKNLCPQPEGPESPPRLPKHPFTSKNDLRHNSLFGRLAAPRDHGIGLDASGDTADRPMVAGAGFKAGNPGPVSRALVKVVACVDERERK